MLIVPAICVLVSNAISRIPETLKLSHAATIVRPMFSLPSGAPSRQSRGAVNPCLAYVTPSSCVPLVGVSRAKGARPMGRRAETIANAAKGILPPAPDFSAETHKRFRGKLAEIVALVEAGDVAALKAFPINPYSSSPKALDRYRNLAVTALETRAGA